MNDAGNTQKVNKIKKTGDKLVNLNPAESFLLLICEKVCDIRMSILEY